MLKLLGRKLAAALPPLLLAIAGCGVGQYSGLGANGGAFSIISSSNAVHTNGQVQFTALLPSGEPAAVSWSVAEGENASTLGEGRIDANGLYTAPDLATWVAKGTAPFDEITATASDGTHATARVPLLAQ